MPTPHPSAPATGLGTPARWSSQAPLRSGEPRRLSRLPDSSFSLLHRSPVFLTQDAPTVSLQSIANPSNICPPPQSCATLMRLFATRRGVPYEENTGG